ncbi:hypothetical protein [Nocardia sp. CDC160]|uniref:hypothetical protein n=1 Tax=Nocardia sp. CDC160 TaxID=3112166 RepID=UPI002DB86A43|nr:hypothetical protein [Nocardia sp. CDC160]MEC3918347.1 hypothetical protein [Nocardia sp. CDC160]
MEVVAAWCGFVGAWVLVAGPMYQGAVELGELGINTAEIRERIGGMPHPRVSPWWWLIPPVAFVKTRRSESAWQRQVLEALSERQRVEFVTYSNKAAGWFVVGGGAALIGVKEAVELVEVMEWPGVVAVGLIVVAAAVALAFTVRRVHLTDKVLRISESGRG